MRPTEDMRKRLVAAKEKPRTTSPPPGVDLARAAALLKERERLAADLQRLIATARDPATPRRLLQLAARWEAEPSTLPDPGPAPAIAVRVVYRADKLHPRPLDGVRVRVTWEGQPARTSRTDLVGVAIFVADPKHLSCPFLLEVLDRNGVAAKVQKGVLDENGHARYILAIPGPEYFEEEVQAAERWPEALRLVEAETKGVIAAYIGALSKRVELVKAKIARLDERIAEIAGTKR